MPGCIHDCTAKLTRAEGDGSRVPCVRELCDQIEYTLRMAANTWIPDSLYKQIQQSVPRVCVDLLPICKRTFRLGLILRETPAQRDAWCLVGGRVWIGESLGDAVSRHLIGTLGDRVRFTAPPIQHAMIAEYLPTSLPPALHDPRQHSIALNWICFIDGEIQACGEAKSFEWYQPAEIPWDNIGFGQGKVIEALLKGIPDVR